MTIRFFRQSLSTLVTWQDEEIDLICGFDDFINLSIIVSSIVINNIKKRWITCNCDELRSEIVD